MLREMLRKGRIALWRRHMVDTVRERATAVRRNLLAGFSRDQSIEINLLGRLQ